MVVYSGFGYSCWIGVDVIGVVVWQIQNKEVGFLFDIVDFDYCFVEVSLCMVWGMCQWYEYFLVLLFLFLNVVFDDCVVVGEFVFVMQLVEYLFCGVLLFLWYGVICFKLVFNDWDKGIKFWLFDFGCLLVVWWY